MSCVSEVLDWSKRLRDNNIAAYEDTYANILYKLGKKTMPSPSKQKQ